MNVRIVLLLLASLLVGGTCAFAQELPPYQIVPDGKQYEIRMGPGQRTLKAISVFFVSTGNMSSAVQINLSGPVGIRGVARGGFIGNLDAATALATNHPTIQPYGIRAYGVKDTTDSFVTASSYNPYYGYVSPWFHFLKNACGSKTDRYVAHIRLDLTGVDPALYDRTFSITLSVKEQKFSRKPVASIKPSSDGKYFGEPILLMNTVGYGNEFVTKNTWKDGRIVAAVKLPVVKYVGYMGYGLSLIRIKNVLKGGKHSWDLTNGGEIYGVCLKATRTRQRVNGYPGGK
ncbi:MAG: hypothetical protein RL518_724 [Pseudomonadota bacterium]|jgi:hypothetical protein